MEDKWFIYYQDGTLHLHRSWGGEAVYRVGLVPDGDGSKTIRTVAAGADMPDADKAYDARLL